RFARGRVVPGRQRRALPALKGRPGGGGQSGGGRGQPGGHIVRQRRGGGTTPVSLSGGRTLPPAPHRDGGGAGGAGVRRSPLCHTRAHSRSVADAGDGDLLALALEDDGVALDLLPVGAGVPGDDHADVRLAAQQVGVGPEVVDQDPVLALAGPADVVALRAVAL